VPDVSSHTVNVTFNGTKKSITFTGNVISVELELPSKGYYEIVAKDTFNNATSSKMINVLECNAINSSLQQINEHLKTI